MSDLSDDAAAAAAPQAVATPLLADLRAAAVLVVALGLAGVPIGWLWSLLAPRPEVVAAGGALDYADGETKAFIAGDGTLFLLGLVAGVAAAVLVWRVSRRRSGGDYLVGPVGTVGTVLGLVAGAALGSWVASRIGTLGGDRDALLAAARSGRLTGRADLPLQLHAHAVLLGWPGAAAAAYAALALRARHRAAAPAPPAAGWPPPAEGVAPAATGTPAEPGHVGHAGSGPVPGETRSAWHPPDA